MTQYLTNLELMEQKIFQIQAKVFYRVQIKEIIKYIKNKRKLSLHLMMYYRQFFFLFLFYCKIFIFQTIEQGQNNRKQNLDGFKKSLSEKQDLEKQREDRIKRQLEIAEIAANDIRDQNLKKWRKLFLVHNFMSTFLKRKMEREMNKYQEMEQGFQKIKAGTGITDAGEIVQKFLNREQTYSHLLISISDYEKKIEHLKKYNEELRNKLHKLKSEIIPTDKQESKQAKLQIDEIYQKYTEVNDKSEHCNLIEFRVYEWMLRTLMKLERCIGSKNKSLQQYQTEFPKNALSEILQKIATILRDNLIPLDKPEQIENVTKAQYTSKIATDISVLKCLNRVIPIFEDKSYRHNYSSEHQNEHENSENIGGQLSQRSQNNEESEDEENFEKIENENVRQLRYETKHEQSQIKQGKS
ncbi:hypothetical protein IMG5_201270 [Ichthyophthirius multifiliis]|uniref:Uncharacterized protein n=1 Tax=Ichthyophthirius multifiliis TaxID=5932 RepID=G0R5Y1_ICHMU|nr:hypothetical protein IMG5_201270 [Ichthyophthirius multifiliis]EGR27105.1 hypothetical protein IMG5_201270 [Ichthyophthirius multifiliis]|eukprot:XP_004023989.1 hypothetical protein IMG5_201270 [Ichthyophthirius multifiliis]